MGVVGQAASIMGIQVTKNNMGNVPGRIVNLNFARPPSISRLRNLLLEELAVPAWECHSH